MNLKSNSHLQMGQLLVSSKASSTIRRKFDFVIFLFMTDEDDYSNFGVMTYIFSPSQTRFTVQVPLINDIVFELTEGLSASLRFVGGVAPPRVTIDPGTAEIIILDDDGLFNVISLAIGGH